MMTQEQKEYHKKYRLNNRKKIAKISKKYSLNNKEKISKKNKKYHLNNKEIRNKKLSIKRKNNFNFKLKGNLRVRLYQAVKGTNKSASTMELLGCSIDKLWNHLESQFKPWMTKENYGLWHVDHIIACAKFDLTCPEQQRTCFHYTNLQPLEAIENMRKGAS
jgi:hypothetical protein